MLVVLYLVFAVDRVGCVAASICCGLCWLCCTLDILWTVLLCCNAYTCTVGNVGCVAPQIYCGHCWLCYTSYILLTVLVVLHLIYTEDSRLWPVLVVFRSYILRTLLVVLPLINTVDSVGCVVPHILWKSFDCVLIVCTVDSVGCVAPNIYCFSSVAPRIYCGQWCCTLYMYTMDSDDCVVS